MNYRYYVWGYQAILYEAKTQGGRDPPAGKGNGNGNDGADINNP